MGEVIAAGFAEYGCDIAAADLNFATAKQTAEKVAGRGRRSVAIRADVGSPEILEQISNGLWVTYGTEQRF